jgi:23S rRNA (uracil1939-C5)-methyltransferase
VKLTIEKMIYGGDGLSRLPTGKAAFLPFVLPGEEVEATVAEEKSGFARATATEILEPSANRTVPACPYFGSCGGCHYQHADYFGQLEIKRSVLRETLRRTAKLDWQTEIVTHAAEPWNYRNRTRIKVRGGADFSVGYYRLASHDLLAVEQCPISSPAINRALAQLWQMGKAQHVPGGVEEIEFFANHDDSRLLVEIFGKADAPIRWRFLKDLQAAIPELHGAGFFSPASGGPKLTEKIGETFLVYKAGDKSFRVSLGSFFQTNRHLVGDLAKTVAGDSHGKMALDLYAGAGLFANHLAACFERVVAVEASSESAGDLETNAEKNVSGVQSTAEQFLKKSTKLRPDLVVIDPPRAGLGDRVTKLLAALQAPEIVYLSCDPATLSRDLVVLVQSGYRVEEVHLFDLFPQTFHVESMVRLAR